MLFCLAFLLSLSLYGIYGSAAVVTHMKEDILHRDLVLQDVLVGFFVPKYELYVNLLFHLGHLGFITYIKYLRCFSDAAPV